TELAGLGQGESNLNILRRPHSRQLPLGVPQVVPGASQWRGGRLSCIRLSQSRWLRVRECSEILAGPLSCATGSKESAMSSVPVEPSDGSSRAGLGGMSTSEVMLPADDGTLDGESSAAAGAATSMGL